jgi:hypothetical protein
MRTTLFIFAALIVGSTPVSAQKVSIEYADEFDFSSLQTYSLARTIHDDPDTQLIHDRIRFAMIREIHRGGMMSVSDEPDLRFVIHLTTGDPTEDLNTRTPGPGWTGWKGAPPSAGPPPTPGTLVVEAIDASSDLLVWRGTGSVTVKAKAKPEKRLKKIDKVISKLTKRWRKITAGEAI